MGNQEMPSKSRIVKLTRDFIKVPSVTGNIEGMNQVLQLAKRELDEFAYEEFVEPTTGTRSLLFFNTPTRPEKFRVILNGHLDVVSGNPNQFKPYVEGDRLYGRGAIDMKGGVATQLLVFKSIAKSLPYPIGLQLVTDEETGGFNGAGYQVSNGVRSDLVISGENTNLDINNEKKGVLVLRATIPGEAAHAAYPSRGDNAAIKAAQLAIDLSQSFPIPANDEEWKTTMNVANISTVNTEHNKIPGEASVLIDFRHIPTDDKNSLRRRVDSLAPAGTKIEEIAKGVALYSDPTSSDLQLLAREIENITGTPARFVHRSDSSDSRHFMEVGSVAIDFGPRGSGAHTNGENGDIKSYVQYAQILTNFLRNII